MKSISQVNQQHVKLPELLVQRKRFNQMEISMDKFLAKKNPIFKQVVEPTPDKNAKNV